MGRRGDAWAAKFYREKPKLQRWQRRLIIATLPISGLLWFVFIIIPEAASGIWADVMDEIEDAWNRPDPPAQS